MDSIKALAKIDQLIDAAETIPPSVDSHEFVEWRTSVMSTLKLTQPEGSTIATSFSTYRFEAHENERINARLSRRPFNEADRFWKDMIKAKGLLRAAKHEIELMTDVDDLIDASAIDPELWAHVSSHVERQDWPTVASQAAIFLEDRIRYWANEPATSVGKGLMANAFNQNGGAFQLSGVPAEQQGWMQLAIGFASAVSNVVRHNLPTGRNDLKRYSIGVLGTVSLLLTQMRHTSAPLMKP